MTRIDLTPLEIALARMIGEAREKNCVEAGVTDYNVTDIPASELDYQGVLGELAFARFANVYPDLDAKPRRHGYDCVYKGHRFDVKATRRVDLGNMIVQARANPDVDCYAQVLLYSDSIAVISGWLYYHEARATEHKTDLGRGPVYVVPKNALRAFRDIRERGAA